MSRLRVIRVLVLAALVGALSILLFPNDALAHGAEHQIDHVIVGDSDSDGNIFNDADCHDGLSCSVVAILMSRSQLASDLISDSKALLFVSELTSGANLDREPPIPILIH